MLDFQLLDTMSSLEVLSRYHRVNSVTDRQCVMHLQLVPNAIKLALQGKMASNWDAMLRDPLIAPSNKIEMCTHAALVLSLQVVGDITEP
jgi:hypothetical protein